MVAEAASNDDISRTYDLLGGATTMPDEVRNIMDAHDLIMRGLPSSALLFFTERLGAVVAEGAVDKAIGVSLRTIQRRRKDGPDRALSTEQSNRVWKFAEILGMAIEVLGSREAAETWMNTPAIGLERRKPIDLLATAAGTEAVETYLTRMDYGVYM